MNFYETLEMKKTERIKELLDFPSVDRSDKMLLELMSFTRDFRLFENISMSNEHKLICKKMSLANFKPNDIIVRQGDAGDSFFYILSGIVKIVVSRNYDLGLCNASTNVTVDKYLGDLKPGQMFGELSLIYGTVRSATIISVTNSAMIKLDKVSFDTYVKDIFENHLKDQIEFMKICPIFHRITKEVLIKVAIATERKKFNKDQVITKFKFKCDYVYIIRRGTVVKPIDFIKDDNAIKKKLYNVKNSKNISYENLKFLKELNEEKLIELLSKGPSTDDYSHHNTTTKNITLETLKMGDIFPSYYCVNNLILDVYYEAESPCDLIAIKINDLSATVPSYAKPYPNDDFLRKFYYYNTIWIHFKSTVKHNIIADQTNNQLLKMNVMRKKLANRKNLDSIRLPFIFSDKKMSLNDK